MVRTNKNVSKKWQGISVFIVDSKSPGIEIRRLETMGMRRLPTSEVFFNDVRVPEANLLGKLDEGWRPLAGSFDTERIGIAARWVGVAQAAFENALEYAKERDAFGKPIGQFQAIQHYLAEMYIDIELARLITYKAAWLHSQGKPCSIEASMAKVAASDAVISVTDKGMRIWAGHGFAMESEMQRYFRDARLAPFSPITDEMAKNFLGQSLGLPRSY